MADKYEYKKFEYDKPWDAEGKYTTFTPGTDTTTAMTNKTNAEKAYSDFVGKGYAYANQQMLNDYMSKYQGRDPFSYDFNTDAMYQQYKDKYMKQGKMAMQDTMGQAAAMTGGYGSSYASTAGNQAYQASLENLNDIIPQLYEMAYARYNQEGQDMLNNISLLQSERGFDYGVWGDKANMLQGDRSYHQTEANNLWNRDYGVYNDNRTFDRGIYESDRNLAHGEHTNSENARYNTIRDAVADEQWKASFDEGQRQFNESFGFDKEKWNWQTGQANETVTGGSGGGTGGNTENTGTTGSTGARITDAMRETAKGFTDNKSLEKYATNLEASGAISHEEALQLVSEFMDYNEKYVVDENGKETDVASYKDMVGSSKGWDVKSKGGGNLVGIDANAKVITPNGETIRLDQLKQKLIAEGMSSSDATKAIKKLQQNLGISSNWFFGL